MCVNERSQHRDQIYPNLLAVSLHVAQTVLICVNEYKLVSVEVHFAPNVQVISVVVDS